MSQYRTGYVSIIGKPNVGKSTLLNQLVDQKISIVSRKPQTTRWSINGIKTNDSYQIIFIDTPGLQINPKFALNRYMNKEVFNTMARTLRVPCLTIFTEPSFNVSETIFLLSLNFSGITFISPLPAK